MISSHLLKKRKTAPCCPWYKTWLFSEFLYSVWNISFVCVWGGWGGRGHALGQVRACWHVGVSWLSHSVMSDSLWPHGLQHARLSCPSPTPGASSNSCSLSRWCHPTISSSVVPFSSCLQSCPASGSFQMSQLFTSGGQSIGTSPSVLPMTIHGWFPFGLTGLIL